MGFKLCLPPAPKASVVQLLPPPLPNVPTGGNRLLSLSCLEQGNNGHCCQCFPELRVGHCGKEQPPDSPHVLNGAYHV